MGKGSKNKSKKSSKQDRVAHLKQVEAYKSAYSLLDQRIDSLNRGENREACEIRNQQLQLTLQCREAFIALGEHKQFRYWLSKSYAGLLAFQIQCQNFIEAFESHTNLMKTPLPSSHYRNSVEPWKDLFVLRFKGFNNDRIQRVIRNIEGIIDTGIAEIIENPLQYKFLAYALFELSRQQLFEAVQYLSGKILQKIEDIPQGSNVSIWIGLERCSSYIRT